VRNQVSLRIHERNFIITLEIRRDYCQRLAVTVRERIPSARPSSDSACKPLDLTLAGAQMNEEANGQLASTTIDRDEKEKLLFYISS